MRTEYSSGILYPCQRREKDMALGQRPETKPMEQIHFPHREDMRARYVRLITPADINHAGDVMAGSRAKSGKEEGLMTEVEFP